MEILVQFIQDNRMRVKELFFQFDKDQSGDITRDEFKTGLKECGIKMSEVPQHSFEPSSNAPFRNVMTDFLSTLTSKVICER